jgi:hypothetical protein
MKMNKKEFVMDCKNLLSKTFRKCLSEMLIKLNNRFKRKGNTVPDENIVKEFQNWTKAMVGADIQIYGPISPQTPLNRRTFDLFLASIDRCQVEVIATFQDILGGRFNYKRESGKLKGSEVVAFIEKAINGSLRAPFNKQISFYDIPFWVEYRKNNGKQFAYLAATCGQPTIVITDYHVFVRG